jgi:hypothetical protein
MMPRQRTRMLIWLASAILMLILLASGLAGVRFRPGHLYDFGAPLGKGGAPAQAAAPRPPDWLSVVVTLIVLALREAIEGVYLNPDIERYIVQLVDATRRDKRVAVGASPRGSLALFKLARVRAALDGRDYVLPDDVKAFVKPALIHRLLLASDL